MRCFEKVTATGSAFWGMPLSISLVTVEYFITSLRSERSTTFVQYEIKFSSNTGYLDHRIFQSEDERTQFIKTNFSDVYLIDSEPAAKSVEQAYFLQKIVGEALVSITFVADYVQFQFSNDHRFNFYIWPVGYQDGKPITEQILGYRDRLCSFIGDKIVGIDLYLDAGLVFNLSSGTIEVPLDKANDDEDPEIAEYHGPEGVWNIWHTGEII